MRRDLQDQDRPGGGCSHGVLDHTVFGRFGGQRRKGVGNERGRCEPEEILFGKESSGRQCRGQGLAVVLIEPQFTYEYKKARLQKVMVTGYPGFFRNFRAVPYEDIRPNCEQEAAPQVVIYSAGEQK